MSSTRSGFLPLLVAGLAASLLAAPAGAAPTPNTLLNVSFQGQFAGNSYRPASGEVVGGQLNRNSGNETLAGGVVGLPGGESGLTFTPSAQLTSGGAVTSSVAVEALMESAQTANHGLNTQLSVAGGAFYRVKQGYQGSSSLNEFGAGSTTGPARAVSDTGFDHIALVYSYAGPSRSTLATYVDGCQVGQTLVNGAPAQAATSTIGFGDDVAAGTTDRGFAGRLKSIAVTEFSGAFSPADLVLGKAKTGEKPAVRPASTIPIGACDSPRTIVDKAANVVPTADQAAWQSEELTGFVHFGPDTFTGLNTGTGTEPVTTFAPTNVDTDQWARSYRDAGFTKVVLVVKHHDGFVLFPSRYTSYSVAFDTAWQGGHGDLVGDFVKSMHKYGLQVGFYLSPADLHEARAGGRYADGSAPHPVTIPSGRTVTGLPTFHYTLDDYNTYYLNQLYELLTQYGPVEEVWLDGANPTDRTQNYDWVDWFAMIHTLQPHAVVFNGQDIRWAGDEQGVGRTSEWSPLPLAGDPATTHMDAEMAAETAGDLGGRDLLTTTANYLSWFPAECDTTLEAAWFWHPDSPPMSLADLMTVYHNTIGRNCQLLLDVPPDQTGQLDAADLSRLHEFGDRIRATFGADPARGSAASASSTNGGHVAAHVVDGDPTTYWQPVGNTATVTITFRQPTRLTELVLQEAIAVGQRVESFGVDADVNGSWQQIASGTTIGYKRVLPLDGTVTASAIRLRITGSRAAPAIATVGVSSYSPPAVTASRR